MLSQFRSFWPGSSSAPASSTATTVPAASAAVSCPAAVMPTTSVIAAKSATESRRTRLRRATVQSCVSLLWVSLVSLFGNIHPLLLAPHVSTHGGRIDHRSHPGDAPPAAPHSYVGFGWSFRVGARGRMRSPYPGGDCE